MSKIIVKADQEEAMTSMVGNVIRYRAEKGAEETIPENSVAYSHQSNGVVERGVSAVEGHIRSLRSALEERIADKLEIGDAIWPWLIGYAGYISNRILVGKDRKTTYERNKGKAARMNGI